jgi:NET1-associated nuclear protein 1 (U3 small nucleolar RNA-associated protein 17)
VLWATRTKVDHIVPYHTSFAAFTSTSDKTTINIYYPSCPTSSTTTIAVPLLKVVAFRNQFIGVAPSGEIFRFGKDVTSSAPATNAITTTSSQSSSIWQEMFGKDAFLDDLAPPQRTVVLPATIARPTDIFDGPSHTLPPVGLMFDAFMSQLLKPKSDDKKDIKSDPIAYQANGEEEEVRETKAAVTGKGPQTKKVTEQDMKELEAFFKDVLSTAPAQNGSNQPSQKMANGNGHGHGDTPKSTPVKAKAVNGDLGATLTDESREKKHTKKRRAPKE